MVDIIKNVSNPISINLQCIPLKITIMETQIAGPKELAQKNGSYGRA